MINKTEVTLTLTVTELDYVVNTLAQRPFSEVNGLIAKVVNQANSQPAPIDLPKIAEPT